MIRRKLLHLVVVMLVVTFVTTLLIDLVPGDPAIAMLGENATPEVLAQVRKDLGLDRTIAERYVDWLGRALQGDFGRSVRTGEAVTEALAARLPVTLELALLALLMSLLVAVPAGIYAGYRVDGRFDQASNLAASFLISAPPFLMGLLLMWALAVKNPIFPVSGWVPFTQDPWLHLKSAFVPALTLALVEIPLFLRLIRADMSATLQENFIVAAAAKGLPVRRILVHHALKPSSFSLLTLAGIVLGRLIGGSVIVEYIFGLPGIGLLLVVSIETKDLTMVQGMVMVVALAYVAINTAIDLLYAWLDPRLRARE